MSPSRSLGLKGLRMVVVYLVGICFAQNRKVVVRLAHSNVLKGGGRGGGGGHVCRTVTPGLNGLLEPPKTVSAFTVVGSEYFTDFSVAPE